MSDVKQNWQKEFSIVQETVLKAGKAVIDYKSQLKKDVLKSKIWLHDIVTNADLQSEKIIIEALKTHFPDDEIISEESSSNVKVYNQALRQWLIDPIDGTKSFVLGENTWGIVVCLLEKGEPVFSMVFLPDRNELFYAFKGLGAWMKTTDINTENTVRVFSPQTEVSLENSFWRLYLSNKKAMAENKYKQDKFYDALKNIGLLWSGSSAGFASTRIILGEYDGSLELKIKQDAPWDLIPSKLLIEEAGAEYYLQGDIWIMSRTKKLKEDLLKSFDISKP